MSVSSKGALPDEGEVLNVNVGVLGHVDSGKTSLVKTLSTLLSTAALDKSKESRERGMTLDLGFSCFFLDMPPHLTLQFPTKTKLQMTLVDCPGHASLIRTIIGGAQIIDMVLLVVDAFKGWQAQTTECLVLAELTSPHLVVALNKVDLFSPEERDASLDRVKRDIQQRLQHTRFAQAPMVGVAACVGGEKVAAVQDTEHATFHMDHLVQVLQDELPPPKRTAKGPFYFSIDHCFPIRGQGTVLTGTVLNGTASVNAMLEFPTLGLERKIKSIQMFRRKVQTIVQGDRAGICVSNFDANLIERGVASTPGAVQLLRGAIALVRKVPYFAGTLHGKSKFHISVGHSTIMATVTFWGARELLQQQSQQTMSSHETETEGVIESNGRSKKTVTLRGHSSLGGDADMAGLPRIPFDFNQDFVQQDQLLETLDDEKGATLDPSLLHWAMLDFHTPVYCPLDSLVIGSRLDAVENSAGSASSCRLAFSGRLVDKVDPQKDITRIRMYVWKERRGVVCRLGDPCRRDDDQTIVRYEVVGDNLFKKETNMKLFTNMKLVTERGEVGEIKSSYGTSGQFRVHFPAGTVAQEGYALILRFKRYVHDASKGMHQDVELPRARCGSRIEVEDKKEKKRPKKVRPPPAKKVLAVGEVAMLKGEVLENGRHNMAIIAGLFSPEVDIREKIGMRVLVPSTHDEGTIAGPFGKAGKCKVAFNTGISAPVGAKVELWS